MKTREVIKVTEPIYLRPPDILRDVELDAREMPPNEGVLVLVGKHQMIEAGRIDNVLIRGNRDIDAGILIKSKPGEPKAYCQIDATVTNCKTSIVMDSREGSYVTAMHIRLIAYGADRFIEMYGRRGKSMGGHTFDLQLQNNGNSQGIFVDGMNNTFRGVMWDNWGNREIPGYNLSPYCKRNVIETNVKSMVAWNQMADLTID